MSFLNRGLKTSEESLQKERATHCTAHSSLKSRGPFRVLANQCSKVSSQVHWVLRSGTPDCHSLWLQILLHLCQHSHSVLSGPREHRASGPHPCLLHLWTLMSKVSPTLSMDLVFYTPCQPLWGRGCLHVNAYPLVCLGVHAYPYAYVLSEAIFRISLHTCTSLSPIPTPTPTPRMLSLWTLLLDPTLM